MENEFLANIVLPDNSSVGEWMLPQIDAAYRNNTMPALLPGSQGHERQGRADRSKGPIPLPPG